MNAPLLTIPSMGHLAPDNENHFPGARQRRILLRQRWVGGRLPPGFRAEKEIQLVMANGLEGVHAEHWSENNYMNAELIQKALEKVGNHNTLINLVSRRVRQLSAGGGGISRPLVADAANLGAADIALREIIEGAMGWDMPELEQWSRPVKRKRSSARPRSKALASDASPVVNAAAA